MKHNNVIPNAHFHSATAFTTAMAVLVLVLALQLRGFLAAPPGGCGGSGLAMMQTKALVDRTQDGALRDRAEAGASRRLTGSEAAAEHAARLPQDASGVAAALREGLQGIWSAVDHFKASPPNVTGGITVLGSTLLQSLNLILTEEGRASWPDYAKFRDFWTKAFEDFDSNFQGIRTDLASFAEEGNVTSLISAVSQVLVQASDMVVDMVPGPLAGTISRALDAVNKAFAAVGEALAEFRDGDTLGGLQALYYGLRNASQGLWSSDDDKDAAFASLVAGLDGIVGGLSEDVLDYQRRLAEGKSCWKVSLARERYLPSICSEGYEYDGERHCWPEDDAKCWEPPAACVMPFEYRGVTYNNCTSRHHNRPWCAHHAEYRRGEWSNCEEVPCASLLSLDRTAWQKKPKGTVPARCDTTVAEDVEKNGGWCFKACPDGYQPFGARCWTNCANSAFPMESPFICGETQAVLQSTVGEMIAVALRSALSLGTVLASMQALGVNAQSLSGTINVFLDMGKPFALPQCSEID